VSDDIDADIAAIGSVASVPTILEVVCRTTGMGFAAVARVTPERWIACSVRDEIDFGLAPGGELKVETTICNEIRAAGAPVVISHVAQDPVYSGHATPAMYGFQSYISVPIMLSGGRLFGTLCAIDPKPAKIDGAETVAMFQLFAELIGQHLETNDRLATIEARLLDEREAAKLREQFIAVLGHDLRNPLASIDAGARMLLRDPASETSRSIAIAIQQSVHRMAGLIDDVMDFARGRLGGGIALKPRPVDLAPVLTQVVEELRAGWPYRRIDAAFALPNPIVCDPSRIAQMFSNLMGNAVKHGAPEGVIKCRALIDDGDLVLWVGNQGDDIPPAIVARLFQPFVRGEVAPHQQGLGLGLYIASEIANGHGGTLTISSSSGETRVVFRMPRASASALAAAAG
jgi:hypothetical protein